MMVDLACEVRIVLLRRFEHNLGAIGELMCCKVDLSETAFADEASKRVVADCVKIMRGELAKEGLI